MRWQNRRRSDNIEDRRGQPGGGLGGSPFGGGRGQIPLKGKSGLVMVVIIVVAGFYGVDLSGLLTGGQMGNVVTQNNHTSYQPLDAKDKELADFTSVVLASTEDVWRNEFQRLGQRYQEPNLVLYRGHTSTACGAGQAVMGPFYCPADQKVYIDLSFYEEMKRKLGGGGDFAQGYVVAHEVGHHVQHLLGIDQKVRQIQQRSGKTEANKLSVKMELQADCFAGVWGHNMEKEGILEQGDLQAALRTAQAIGDDRLQQQGQGRIVPDSFTHGTSEQRYTWFKRGFDSGDMTNCNTFDTQ